MILSETLYNYFEIPDDVIQEFIISYKAVHPDEIPNKDDFFDFVLSEYDIAEFIISSNDNSIQIEYESDWNNILNEF